MLKLCPALVLVLLQCSMLFGQFSISDQWQMTLQEPAAGWEQPNFEDSQWSSAAGGFGTFDTPGARIGTEWSTNDIWLRKSIEVSTIPAHPALYVHHDEDAEIYLNGKLIATLSRYSTRYDVVPLSPQAQTAIKQGLNTIAVHCRQTSGGQFIDVHLIDADAIPKLPRPKRDPTPFQSELLTEWGAQVTADNAWLEYPRPQLARKQWINLNGSWDYAITSVESDAPPTEWAGKILVPFSVESKLGGVQHLLEEDEALWYHRAFEATAQSGKRTLLNFEAVDYQCVVFVNGQRIGEHRGGNDAFSFDISTAIKPGPNDLMVRVQDETEGWQLNGKQSLRPRGIWYTQVSGIWQTVWMEEVPEQFVSDLSISTDANSGTIDIRPTVSGAENFNVQVDVFDGETPVAQATSEGNKISLVVQQPKLWSPDSPHLYKLVVKLLGEDGSVADQVDSYAGIRSVGKVQDADGHWRFTLNGKPIFHWGPLDQGWWPDGLLTPPSDAAMLFDIEFLKSAGFNMIRKHIKVEPRRYYYHCDRIGMLVWQDQVSGGRNPPWTHLDPNPTDATWPQDAHEQFMLEFERMVDQLENHPSIVVWTPFNEAWGQHQTVEVGKWIQQRDPSRLVNVASGGNFWPVGDVVDQHSYPDPDFPFDPSRFADFIKVVGEFGGHGFPVAGHLWDTKRENWGYGSLPKNLEEYQSRYIVSLEKLNRLRKQGIAAGVYTQTTDVEGEINGLMTYDRKVIKISAEELSRLHQQLND